MNAPASSPAAGLAAELDAALQWWRMAGVDCDFSDDATDWLGAVPDPAQAAVPEKAGEASGDVRERAQMAQPVPVSPDVERFDLLGPNPPTDLAKFRQFWLEAPGLDTIGPRGRVAPRGPAQAELMVLVIDPEERDSERLLGGPQGRLLSRMLIAMGLGDDQVYVASALPRHTPMADTQRLAGAGMDAVVLHHIALAAPKRILAFGGNILPLIGHELPKDAASLREINQSCASVPLLVSEGLDSLMAMPRLKTRFWRRWMEWSAEL